MHRAKRRVGVLSFPPAHRPGEPWVLAVVTTPTEGRTKAEVAKLVGVTKGGKIVAEGIGADG